MKQKKDLLSILNHSSLLRLKFNQSPKNSKVSLSNLSIRIRTQTSLSPTRNVDKSLNLSYVTLTLQFENKNIPITLPTSSTTDDLLSLAKTHFPKITQLVTVHQELVVDYTLTLPARSLEFLKNKILILTGFVGQPSLSKDRRSLRDYILIKCIGTGGFSRVYLSKGKDDGRFYAIKFVDKSRIQEKHIENIIENERNILAVTNHTFLNKMHFCFEATHFLVFVTDFCPGGDLLHYLNKAVRFTEQQAKFYVVEFLLGLLYLHQLDIIYRDIKPENILIDIDGHIQIGDFGLAKPNSNEQTYSFCGSPEYMAPEMLKNDGHNQQLDHYCVGVLLYEMVVGVPPFYSKDVRQIYIDVLQKNISFPKDLAISLELKDLITRLLVKDTQHRLGYRGGLLEILDHPWFGDVDLLSTLAKKTKPPFAPDLKRLPPFNTMVEEGDLEIFRRLTDRQGHSQVMFKNFYYDMSKEADLKQEQLKFYKFYMQLVEQQQGKYIRKKRLRQNRLLKC